MIQGLCDQQVNEKTRHFLCEQNPLVVLDYYLD